MLQLLTRAANHQCIPVFHWSSAGSDVIRLGLFPSIERNLNGKKQTSGATSNSELLMQDFTDDIDQLD